MHHKKNLYGDHVLAILVLAGTASCYFLDGPFKFLGEREAVYILIDGDMFVEYGFHYSRGAQRHNAQQTEAMVALHVVMRLEQRVIVGVFLKPTLGYHTVELALI